MSTELVITITIKVASVGNADGEEFSGYVPLNTPGANEAAKNRGYIPPKGYPWRNGPACPARHLSAEEQEDQTDPWLV